jgi:hypothetical protein
MPPPLSISWRITSGMETTVLPVFFTFTCSVTRLAFGLADVAAAALPASDAASRARGAAGGVGGVGGRRSVPSRRLLGCSRRSGLRRQMPADHHHPPVVCVVSLGVAIDPTLASRDRCAEARLQNWHTRGHTEPMSQRDLAQPCAQRGDRSLLVMIGSGVRVPASACSGRGSRCKKAGSEATASWRRHNNSPWASDGVRTEAFASIVAFFRHFAG